LKLRFSLRLAKAQPRWVGHKLWSQNVTARGIELAGEGGTTGILAAKTPDASATLSPFGITHLNAFSWSDLPMFSMVYLSQNRSLIYVTVKCGPGPCLGMLQGKPVALIQL